MSTKIQTLAMIAWDWGMRCFGHEHMTNPKVRALRFLEEAAELAQACGVDEEKALACIEIVYGRPIGSPQQELGGCMVTLSVLSLSLTMDLESCFEREIRRCLSKTPEEFAKRNQDKLDLGLT
jgi:NTP pyrophosphatase (non-canonical NTP hydrolase)